MFMAASKHICACVVGWGHACVHWYCGVDISMPSLIWVVASTNDLCRILADAQCVCIHYHWHTPVLLLCFLSFLG